MPSHSSNRLGDETLDVVISGVPYGFQGNVDDGRWLTDDQIAELQSISPAHRIVHCSPDEIAARLRDGDLNPEILFVETTGLEEGYKDIPWIVGLEDFRRMAESVRWIHMCSAGIEHVLPIVPDDVVLTNASGVHAPAIAESVLAAIFFNARCLAGRLANQSARAWQPLACTELAGAKLLIIGTGEIGTAVAERATALGMDCVGVNRSGHATDHFATTVSTQSMEPMTRTADYIVVACPLTPQTHHLLSRRLLEGLKPDCFVINISRGDVVDQEALIDLLGEPMGPAGAYLDAFSTEPLPPDHRAWDTPGLLLTPHDAHSSNLLGDRQFELFRRNLGHFATTGELENIVDRSVGY